EITFQDVKFGLGTFMSRILGPVFQQLQQVTAPLADVFKILDIEVPGISDIMKLNKKGAFTIRDLAQLTAESGLLPPDWKFIVEMSLAGAAIGEAVQKSTYAN